jgi:hypothetical protein
MMPRCVSVENDILADRGMHAAGQAGLACPIWPS